MISSSIITKNPNKDAVIYSSVHTTHYDYCGSHVDVSTDKFKDVLQKVTLSVEVLIMLEDSVINHIAHQTKEFLVSQLIFHFSSFLSILIDL
jgi:hypothetical protein